MTTRANFRERRQKRREEAEKRRVVREKRSDAEQLALVRTRPGESKREVARLDGASRR